MRLSHLQPISEAGSASRIGAAGLIVDALVHVGASSKVIAELKKLKPHQEVIDLAVAFYNGAASIGATLNTLEQVALASEKLRIESTLGTYLERLETQTGTDKPGINNLDEVLKAINTMCIFKYEQAPYLKGAIPVFKALIELQYASKAEGAKKLDAAVARATLRKLGVTREAS